MDEIWDTTTMLTCGNPKCKYCPQITTVPPRSIKNVVQEGHQDRVSPEHYKTPIQPWDFIVSNALGFLEGNIIKYVCRYLKKDGLKDLYKARHYLDKLIKLKEIEANDSNRQREWPLF